MKLLAVETATEACSAALLCDGELLERFQLAPKIHTKLLLPMIDSLMAEAFLKPNQLDVLAFGCGPGSFTGVRIATGVIQGIALGLDLPVAPVSTLAAIAQEFFVRNSAIDVAFTAIDARMNEIFWGIYQKNSLGLAQLQGEESVTPASEIVRSGVKGAGIGTGWLTYRDILCERLADSVVHIETDNLPRASAIAVLGERVFRNNQAVPVEKALPVYLRNKVAKKESERELRV